MVEEIWRDTWYQRSQAANAAIIYEKLQKAVRANDIKTTRNVAGEILEQYPRTTYAPFAAMLSAKVHFESGDLKTARAQLQWAETKSRSDGLKAIARLRLAGVLIDDNAASDAERLLVEKPEPGFEALYSAMRGDALLAQHKGDEAKTAYKAALDAGNGLEPSMRDLVKMKLGALGEY